MPQPQRQPPHPADRRRRRNQASRASKSRNLPSIRCFCSVPALVPILFGAILTIAAAYGLGLLLLRRLEAPPEIVFATGAAGLSVVTFFIVLAGCAKWPVFLAFGTALCAAGGFAGRPYTWAMRGPASEQTFKARFPRF